MNILPFLSQKDECCLVHDSLGCYIKDDSYATIRLFDSVESTFTTAHELVKANALLEWESVLAVTQTRGKGQYDRTWISPSGNIYASIRLPKISPFNGWEASPALGGILATILSRIDLPIFVKWPNDLIFATLQNNIISYRKIGGILLQERNNSIIAGIGINVSSAPSDECLRKQHAFPAGCLPIPTLISHDIHSLVQLWMYIVLSLKKMNESNDVQNWHSITEKRLLSLGKLVEIREEGKNEKITKGKLLGIDKITGGLRLLTDRGEMLCESGTLHLNESLS